ncbi:MAG: hypothetical protein EBZ17_08365 [Actinobacteria bacterium]|nr:hypothetical protein [Actinomycetota bacterium]
MPHLDPLATSGEYEWLLEEWDYLTIEDVRADGKSLVVTGREDRRDRDEQAAAISVDGSSEFIDEADSFGYVRYLKDENIVMYTSYDDGATTYQHKIGSRTQPTVVYEDSAVKHAGWDANGQPVAFIPGRDINQWMEQEAYYQAAEEEAAEEPAAEEAWD